MMAGGMVRRSSVQRDGETFECRRDGETFECRREFRPSSPSPPIDQLTLHDNI